MSQDWTAPPRSEAPDDPLPDVEWKAIDESHRDRGVRIYALAGFAFKGNVRLVATCERLEEAELIVELYEKWRAAR